MVLVQRSVRRIQRRHLCRGSLRVGCKQRVVQLSLLWNHQRFLQDFYLFEVLHSNSGSSRDFQLTVSAAGWAWRLEVYSVVENVRLELVSWRFQRPTKLDAPSYCPTASDPDSNKQCAFGTIVYTVHVWCPRASLSKTGLQGAHITTGEGRSVPHLRTVWLPVCPELPEHINKWIHTTLINASFNYDFCSTHVGWCLTDRSMLEAKCAMYRLSRSRHTKHIKQWCALILPNDRLCADNAGHK